jgi:hypothetical protein
MQQIPLTLEQARARGDAGMVRAAVTNERKNGGWSTLALGKLVEHVKSLPFDAEFIVEDLRLAIEDKVPEPTDLRAWGAVTQTAIRARYIEKTGRIAPAKSSNASPKPLYCRGGGLL